jgi:hypothetical protein
VAAAPVKLGLTFPAMTVAAGNLYGRHSVAAAGGALTTAVEGTGFFNQLASGSIIYSVANGTSAVVYHAMLEGLFVVSTAGTIQLQAGASTTTGAVHIQRGSFIQAFRIG